MAAYTGTPRTWTAGETVTAALMNSDVRDPLAALSGAWTSYTPTLAQGVDVTFTNQYAKYIRVGKLVICQFSLSATSAGTASAAVTVTLPVTAASSVANMAIGSADLYDATAPGTRYPSTALLASTTTVAFSANGSAPGPFGSLPAITLASGDLIRASVMYEAA